MRNFLALLIGLSVGTFASHALGQDSAQRDAAIAKCIAEAHKQYPLPDQQSATDRTFVYKACMTREGQRP